MEILALINHFDRQFAGKVVDFAATNDPVLTEIQSLGKRFNMTQYRVREMGRRDLTVEHDPNRLNILVNFIGNETEKTARIGNFSIG